MITTETTVEWQVYEAIKRGEVDSALDFIKDEIVNMNWRDKEGHNLLHAVCEHAPSRHMSIVKELVKKLLASGISINTATRVGKETPLHICCSLGKFTLAETLLKHRADPNLRDKEGETPLHLIQMFYVGKVNKDWTRLLRKYKARDYVRNSGALTPEQSYQEWNSDRFNRV